MHGLRPCGLTTSGAHRARRRQAVPCGAHGAELPRFIKDEFNAFVECGNDKLPTFSCKRLGTCPSFGARHMSRTAAHLVDDVRTLL